MKPHTQQIDKLLTQEKKAGRLFLSFYLPAVDQSKDRLAKEIKAVVNQAFADNLRTKHLKKIPGKIVSGSIDWLRDQEEIGRGIAGFARFEASESNPSGRNRFKEDDLLLINLNRKPEPEAYVGATYDLDQLVWFNNSHLNSLLLHLERQTGSVYLLFQRRLRLVKEWLNQQAATELNESLDKYVAVDSKGAFFGMGKDARNRKHRQQNQGFLNNIIHQLKKQSELTDSFESVLVFYSTAFAGLMVGFKQELVNQLGCPKPVLVNKVFKKKDQLRQAAIDQMKKHRRRLRADFYQQVKEEEYDRYREGWEQVAAASREKKIDTLFVKPQASKAGYVLDNQLVYPFPKQAARKVNNIGPWLVRSVLRSGGRLVVFEQGADQRPEVAARLRY